MQATATVDAAGVAVGDTVICFGHDKPVTYGGQAPDGVSSMMETTIGLLAGTLEWTVRCPVTQVAPAGTPIPDRDPRVNPQKMGRGLYPTWQGPWRLAGTARYFKTKREATAAGLRMAAIHDWHTAQPGPPAPEPGPDPGQPAGHQLIEAPDDKYPHLTHLRCSCGKWSTSGFVLAPAFRPQYVRHAAGAALAESFPRDAR